MKCWLIQAPEKVSSFAYGSRISFANRIAMRGQNHCGIKIWGSIMITSLRLVDFKNFADATLRAGPFTVIVGTNASGKSNIRDAFRFLHGIGRGYTLAEIIGSKYGSGGQIEWAPIRGAANEIIRFGKSGFSLEVELTIDEGKVQYSIKVEQDKDSRSGFRVTKESLKLKRINIFTSHPSIFDPVSKQNDSSHLFLRMAKTGEQRKLGNRIAVRPDQPALTQVREHRNVVRLHKYIIQSVIDNLAGIRFLDPIPEMMRKPTFPGQTMLGDSGENLPTVLQEICADPKRGAVFYEWVRELTPMDVERFDFPRDPITGLVQLAIGETNEREVSAYSASDGTLRFLAMLAGLLGRQTASPGRIGARSFFFEEIDNGIHPSRLRLLLDLIEGQTAKGGLQVITTTHSPDLLAMIGDNTFKSTSVVCRLPDTDNSVIRPVCDLPRSEALRNSQGLGRLHASGWMEDALAFAEEDEGQAE